MPGLQLTKGTALTKPLAVGQTVLISARSDKGALVLVVAGELDATNVAPLGSALHDAGRNSSGPVVIDLSAVAFADSSTVNVILQARAELGSRLHLAAPSPFMERLISVIGLTRVLSVCPTVDEAIAASAQLPLASASSDTDRDRSPVASARRSRTVI